MPPGGPVSHPGFSLAARLATLPYFSALDLADLAALAGQAACRHFAAGEMLFGQDEPSAGLWIVETGRVKIFRLSPAGREYVLRLPGPGDSFNDIPALDGGPNAASAIALTDTVAWVLSSAVLRAELERRPGLALSALSILTARIRDLVQQAEDLALYSVPARLARFLLRQLEDKAADDPVITRATIAAHLATTPETVSRALRMLEEIGAIRFDRQHIIILREDLLRAIALE
jgi:CRP/FNR family transcriptional regulator